MAWTAYNVPAAGYYAACAASPSRYVIYSYDPALTYYGPDGINWTTPTFPALPIPANYQGHVRWIGGSLGFVALVGGPATASTFSSSADGTNWGPVSCTDDQWQDMAYSGTRYVCISNSGYSAQYSANGSSWTFQGTGLTIAMNAIAYGAGLFVAVGPNGCMTSPNGVTWTARTLLGGLYFNVAFGNGMFVATGDNLLASSPNGITWTARSPTLPYGRAIAFGGGMFVIANSGTSDTTTLTSADGVNWTVNANDFPSSQAIGEICFGQGKFLATSLSPGTQVMVGTPQLAPLRRPSAMILA